jgi:hypothetical protein
MYEIEESFYLTRKTLINWLISILTFNYSIGRYSDKYGFIISELTLVQI